jgi:hypothetical protein
VLEQVTYRGALTESGFEGTFEARARRPDGAAEFMELRDVGVALSELTWSDAAAIWGTAPDDRTLLRVDRPTGILSGKWSIRGRSAFGRQTFDLGLLPAGSTRLELSMPRGLSLRCAGGIVLDTTAESGDRRVWSIELGQRSRCTCIVEPDGATGPPLLQSDRTLIYSIRSELCRLQADFTVHAQRSVPAQLAFRIPADLEDVTVSYATSIKLPGRSSVEGDSATLTVPLPALTPGRIGTIRT